MPFTLSVTYKPLAIITGPLSDTHKSCDLRIHKKKHKVKFNEFLKFAFVFQTVKLRMYSFNQQKTNICDFVISVFVCPNNSFRYLTLDFC